MRFLATILLLMLKRVIVITFFLFTFLAAPRGMWDHSSQPGTEPAPPAQVEIMEPSPPPSRSPITLLQMKNTRLKAA